MKASDVRVAGQMNSSVCTVASAWQFQNNSDSISTCDYIEVKEKPCVRLTLISQVA